MHALALFWNVQCVCGWCFPTPTQGEEHRWMTQDVNFCLWMASCKYVDTRKTAKLLFHFTLKMEGGKIVLSYIGILPHHYMESQPRRPQLVNFY